ncbi:hypothetical protein [Minwuia sp.]|uniref:hypothetical protein n=1 Tax=Minwuia sp. TaxID=2493630 RepID=UPI003A95ADFB
MERHHAPLLSFDLPDPKQVWLVVFLDPPAAPPGAPWRNRFLSRALTLLRPGFRHVLAVSPLGDGKWLICNPGSCFLGLGVAESHQILPPIRRGIGNGTARCRVFVAGRPEPWQVRGLFTCVNVVAHLVGMKTRPFMTPRQLYRRMAAMQG